jgi:hypothetical protein
MYKYINESKYNALKHGVSSMQGLLPNEKPEDYAALEAQWVHEYQPHGMILKSVVTCIVRNRWLSLRNSQSMAIFVSCHPFGRAVAEAAGDGDWVETARKLLSDLNAQLKKIGQAAESLCEQAATTENAADKKRLSKAAAKLADAAQHIANRHDMAMEFFLGLGDEIKKQADRDMDLDGKLDKLMTSYYRNEQMLATREKHPPFVSHQSSVDVHDEFIDELPENSEPKAAHPVSEKKVLPDSKKDSFDNDDDWVAPQKH